MILTPGSHIRLPGRDASARLVRGSLGPGDAAAEGLREVQLPYGRYLYVLPLTRTPVEYAGYTFERAAR